MNATIQKAVQVERAVVRTPLVMLDERVLSRVGVAAPLRSVVEKTIGTLDAVTGRLGHTAAPTGEPSQPAGFAEPAWPAGTPEHEPVPVEEVEELADVLLAEQEQEHQLAGELADDEELRRVQAELKAKHQVEEEHEAHQE